MNMGEKRVIQKFLQKNPVILAVKNDEELKSALNREGRVIFLLYGNICNLRENVHLVKEKGKMVFVHADRIDGCTSHNVFVDFLKKEGNEVDGLISTHPRLLKYAREQGMISILRVFLLDSLAVSNSLKSIAECQPDLVEVLPGIATGGFKLISNEYNGPLIAGGLIKSSEDVLAALAAGAIGISTTNLELSEINRLIREELQEKEQRTH